MVANNQAFEKNLVPVKTVTGQTLNRQLIEKETRRVAKHIGNYFGTYSGDEQSIPIIVGVLFGALHIHPLLMEGFSSEFMMHPALIRAKSYGKGRQDTVQISDFIVDGEIDLKGRRVLIVDDIVESGQTLYTLKNWFMERHVAEVKTFTLLSKPQKRLFQIDVDWTVFEIGSDDWVVGMGLDDMGKFRNFSNIVTAKDRKRTD
jgi:hypoxanthine phosphoribosyltransferase